MPTHQKNLKPNLEGKNTFEGFVGVLLVCIYVKKDWGMVYFYFFNAVSYYFMFIN